MALKGEHTLKWNLKVLKISSLHGGVHSWILEQQFLQGQQGVEYERKNYLNK